MRAPITRSGGIPPVLVQGPLLGKGKHAPVNALLLQGAVALALVAAGALSKKRFVMMVEYTAPVSGCFFLLTVVSLMALRRSDPGTERPFRTPL